MSTRKKKTKAAAPADTNPTLAERTMRNDMTFELNAIRYRLLSDANKETLLSAGALALQIAAAAAVHDAVIACDRAWRQVDWERGLR